MRRRTPGPSRRRAWRPLLRAWMRWRWRDLEDIPIPVDRPFASVHGVAPIDCLVLGNGPISGWGVATHQLGMVGALSRVLARRLRRGVTVRARIDPEWTVPDMLAPARAMLWSAAGVGVLAFGPNEILGSTSSRRWQSDLERLVRDIRERLPQGSVLLVIGIPPVGSLPYLRGLGATYLQRLIERYNDRARDVCDAVDGVRFIELPDTGASRLQHRTAEHYERWAETAGSAVARDLSVVRSTRSDDEAARDAAVEHSGLLDGLADESAERVVRLARSVFRTEAAAFTVLHGGRALSRATTGADGAMSRLGRSICETVVEQGEPLVVGDVRADPRFEHDAPLHDGTRFCAGYPVRSPDGHSVGALCVFDSEPRDPADVNVATLRDLALMLEADLADGGARPGRGPATL